MPADFLLCTGTTAADVARYERDHDLADAQVLLFMRRSDGWADRAMIADRWICRSKPKLWSRAYTAVGRTLQRLKRAGKIRHRYSTRRWELVKP